MAGESCIASTPNTHLTAHLTEEIHVDGVPSTRKPRCAGSPVLVEFCLHNLNSLALKLAACQAVLAGDPSEARGGLVRWSIGTKYSTVRKVIYRQCGWMIGDIIVKLRETSSNSRLSDIRHIAIYMCISLQYHKLMLP